MKLNVGCGIFPLEGYHNVDISPGSLADQKTDFFNLDYEPDSLDEFRADHWLEHVDQADGVQALQHAYFWLKPGGRLRIEVPNMGAVLAGYTGGWPWQQVVYGAQPSEHHLFGYTAHSLEHTIRDVGEWRWVQVTPFISNHEMRRNFPCLLAEAIK